MTEAIFTRDGDLFVPTDYARGPWRPDTMHGGPPAGLLARALEQHVGDPAFQMARITIDLFRQPPFSPASVEVRPLREGRRIRVLEASMIADGVEITRASALFLLRSDAEGQEHPVTPPRGPEELPGNLGFGRPTPGAPPIHEQARRPGFGSSVETRWVSGPGETPPTVWLRFPVPLVEGEETSPSVRAVTVSDLANPLSNQVADGGMPRGFINADNTLYMHREPEGEWLCVQAPFHEEIEGVGVVESIWYDRRGRYGRGVEARLAQERLRF